MPRVGSKSFAYTPAGQQQAAALSRTTGQPVVNTGGYKKGGKATKAKGGVVKKAKGGRVKAMHGGMKAKKKK